MVDTIRTRDQLLSLFPDNVSRLISPQRDRDFIASSFGYLASTDPGPDNDRADTAGLGAKFDFGSRWVNLLNHRVWTCMDGQPTAAVWSTPNPSPGYAPVRGEVLLNLGAVAALSGLPIYGAFTLPAGTVVVARTLADSRTIGAYVVDAGPWSRVSWWPDGEVIDRAFFYFVQFEDHYPYVSRQALWQVDVAGTIAGAGPWTVGVDTPEIRPVSGGFTMTTPSDTFTNPIIVEPFGAVALNLITQSPHHFWRGPLNLPSAIPHWGPIDTSDLPLIPKLLIDPTGQWTVPEIPGLPATIIVSGVFPISRIPSIPVSYLTGPGTIDPALFPGGIGTCAGGSATGTTTPSAVTIFDETSACGINGVVAYRCTAHPSFGNIRFEWTLTNMQGSTATVASILGTGSGEIVVPIYGLGGYLGTINPPYTHVKLTVKDGAGSGDYSAYWSLNL